MLTLPSGKISYYDRKTIEHYLDPNVKKLSQTKKINSRSFFLIIKLFTTI